MRTLCLLANFVVLAVAFYFGSLLGLAIALGICVVLVTLFFIFSTATSEAREAALRAGADHYLTKPLNVEQFVHVMQQAASAGWNGGGNGGVSA